MKSAVLAMAVAGGIGAASTSVSANIVAATGGPGFSGLSASGANHTFTVTGAGGTIVVICPVASFGGINGVGNMDMSFAPVYSGYTSPGPPYSGCFADLGMYCATRVTTAGAWTLTQGGTKTGGWSGSFSLSSAIRIAIDDYGCGIGPTDCTINIPAQSGLTGSSVLAANDASSTAMKLSGTVTGITWTSSTANCSLGTGAANGTYSFNGASGTTFNGVKLN